MKRQARRAFLGGCAGLFAAAALRRDGPSPPVWRARRDLATGELRAAERRAALCTSANAAGVGLRGEYFGAEGLRGKPILVRVDGTIDLDASLDWPAAQDQRRPRSVRWAGWVKPPLSGHYRFHVDAPGARVMVSQRVLCGPSADADMELAAGRFYPISVELPRIALAGASDRIRLEWTAPHGMRFVVPRALLYLPTEATT